MTGLPPHRRLAVQMAVTVALLAVAVFGATGWLLLERERENLTRELTLRMLAETRALGVAASSALLRHDPELELHPLVTRLTDDVDELLELSVIDAEGICQGHRDLARIGSTAESLPADAHVLLSQEGARALESRGLLYIEREVRHLGRAVGRLRATVDRSGIDATVAASTRRLAWTGGTGTAVGILLVLLLVTHRLRPLEPLREGVQRIGSGELDTRVRVSDRSEFGLLAEHVNAMAEGLARAQDERIRQERIERELEIAHQIQETLLPRRLPRRHGVEVAGHYTPALEVSGDYYDVFEGEDDRLFFVVADVSGKGVPGMVVMAMTKVILRELSATEPSPGRILQRANAILVGLIPRQMFVTLALGALDADTGELVYASAGHCPPIRFGLGPAEEMEAGGKPLGIFPPAVFDPGVRERRSQLRPGEAMLLYTDGLTECENRDRTQLGEAAVLETLVPQVGSSAQAGVDALVNRANDHRGSHPANDDLTLVAIRRGVSPRVEVGAR